MKVLSSILLVLLSAPSPVDAFVQPNRLSGRSTSSSFLQSAKAKESTKEDSAATVDDEDEDDDGYNLDPAFRQAYQQAEQGLTAAIPSKAMLTPLLHFTKEYIAANQQAAAAAAAGQAAEAAASSSSSPEKAVGNIMEAIQLGVKYGTGESKYIFGSSHTAMRGSNAKEEDGNEYDFYQFGIDFFRPVVQKSVVLGQDNLQTAIDYLKKGDNVVFLANHQSEADPQVMSICLEDELSGQDGHFLAEQLVYVAGHKVTTDPLAIPFSMGRNLICIHSKKHMDAEPELKSQKQRENLGAMGAMLRRLKNSKQSDDDSDDSDDKPITPGCALWVAPSGGRDRRNLDDGTVPPAPFDQKTIDMFRLMGNKSKVPTHFFSLAMVTYDLCPPPDAIEAGVGEQRNVRFVPVGIHCGAELTSEGGLEKRHEFAAAAFDDCVANYNELVDVMKQE